ncbi:MAG: hypothetical protein AB7O57_21040 [Hyphomicrobiaceae bacterium]
MIPRAYLCISGTCAALAAASILLLTDPRTLDEPIVPALVGIAFGLVLGAAVTLAFRLED